MTEGDTAPDKGQRARLLAGRISCIVGLLLGVVQVSFALPNGDADTSAGILGIAFCILGYYLNSRKLATATVFVCVAAVILSLSAFQHFSLSALSVSASSCSARGTVVCSVRGDARGAARGRLAEMLKG